MVTRHRGVRYAANPTTDFWATLNHHGPWSDELGTSDRARTVWGKCAEDSLSSAAYGVLQVAKQRKEGVPPLDIGQGVDGFPPSARSFLDALTGNEPDVLRACEALQDVFRDPYANYLIAVSTSIPMNASTERATMSKPIRVAIYARVSTDGQTTENQRRELRAAVERHGWSIAAEYIDHGISGAKGRKDRPQFDALRRAVARKEIDLVAAWSVDRLGRSLQDLVGFLSDLQSKRVDLYMHQQALDTSTPSGKAMFGSGVFAEFERSIIQERVKAGLARARAKGRTLGRPRIDTETEQRIRELAARG